MNVDLNIENYGYQDILDLFHLEGNFDDNDIKKAKKIVYQTHPDKSHLPKEYFLFFAKALKYLVHIYQFKRRQNENITDYELVDESNNIDDSIHVDKVTKNENFHKWFNTMFDKYNIQEKEDGYDDWLKTEDDDTSTKMENANQMHHHFDQYKSDAMKQLVIRKDIQDVYNNLSCGGSTICKIKTDDYSSTDIFSQNLAYRDVKNAHTETFIPVSKETFDKKQKYRNVTELNMERGRQNLTPPSELQMQEYMNQKQKQEDELSSRQAYNLLKQQEKQDKMNALFMRDLRHLK